MSSIIASDVSQIELFLLFSVCWDILFFQRIAWQFYGSVHRINSIQSQWNDQNFFINDTVFFYNFFIKFMGKYKKRHLPKSVEEKNQLIQRLKEKVQKLKAKPAQVQSYSQQINTLQLRIKLIADCSELSVQRIQHLEEIFKHYCTHIFKIGKHMTFQRLEYEKVHLTLDRLCIFLKDFGLTVAEFDGDNKEIIQKGEIVRTFKRISSNCRDLSFEEFIACLQKLGSVYYDSKRSYHERVAEQRKNRDKRIAQYKAKIKKLKQEEERHKLKNKLKEKGDYQPEQQNDKLVEDMMNDQNLSNPNDEIKEGVGKSEYSEEKQEKQHEESHLKDDQQNKNHLEIKNSQLKEKKNSESEDEQLTVEEKAEYFYQMIGVDSVKDFRNKMGELNLPLFKQYQKKPLNTKQTSQIHVSIERKKEDEQSMKRLIELRERINQKRQRDKHSHSHMISKEEYEERKRRREGKQTDAMREMVKSRTHGKTAQETTQSRFKNMKPEKKKIDPINESELSLDMINKLSLDELKYKFDPKKYTHADESDNIYLIQYGSVDPSKQKKDRAKSTMEIKKKNSSSIVDDFKRRAEQIEKKEFHRQAKLTKFMQKIKNNQKILSRF